jgi:hypothetical protein
MGDRRIADFRNNPAIFPEIIFTPEPQSSSEDRELRWDIGCGLANDATGRSLHLALNVVYTSGHGQLRVVV